MVNRNYPPEMPQRTEVSKDGAGAVVLRPPATPFVASLRSDVVRAALVAGAIAAALAAFGPPGGDAPAHLYRVLLAREGALVWDNLWYAGHYPFSSYSLLYYLPAGLVGNLPVVLAAVVAAAALFASLATREWGEAARWPSRAFAVAACAPVFTGTYSYAVALAALLGSLHALQSGRLWLAVGAAALTIGFSPLAFVFLVLALAAIAIRRRKLDRVAVVMGAGLLGAAAVQLLIVSLFQDNVVYPFRGLELFVVLGVCGLGAALAFRSPRGRTLAVFLLLWAGASVVFFLAPSPVGENITRLRGVVFPLVLLAAVLVRFRPRLLAAAALAASLAYMLVPYVAVIPYRTDGRPEHAAFWEPALEFVRAGSGANFRVEVVPTGDHWEAYWVPESGLALARGWYRQIDIKENELFYRPSLEAATYRAWLRELGVRYVLLPSTQLDRMSAAPEAELLRSGRSGLRPVFRNQTAIVYELPGATRMLAGPGRASLSVFGHDRIEGRIDAPGVYRLAVRFTPYWTVGAGSVCTTRAADGMTLLHATQPGGFTLSVEQDAAPIAGRLIGRDSGAC
jgi:hypothetical protein